MEKIISATEVVRDFSTILNKIKFGGEHYIIKRSGKPVARISPIQDEKQISSLKDLKRLLEQLPKLGDELDSFSMDIKSLNDEQPEAPEKINWA
ncbi:MAG: type II toxin-antitoxin system Phd/YefM family antitoxin [Desulfobacteraceae bacterium]